MAIALTRAEEIENARSGQSIAMSPRWIGTIFLAALIVILTTALATAVLSGRDVHEIIGWLGPFALAASFLQTAVWITLANLAFPLAYLLDFLVALFIALYQEMYRIIFRRSEEPEVSGEIVNTPGSIFDLLDVIEPVEPYLSSRTILVALMVIAILLVGLALNRTVNRAHLRPQGELQVDGAAQGGNIAGARPGLAQRLMQALGLWRQRQAAASVRRIYAQMAATAAATGYPRAEAQTPYEYQSALQQLWPDGHREVVLITHAYVRVRYGEAPETQAELDEIKAAWARLAQMNPENRNDQEYD
jgi:hypothetical protein